MERSRTRQVWIISFVATVVLMAAYMGGFFVASGSYLTDSNVRMALEKVSIMSAIAAAVTTVTAAISFIQYKEVTGIEKIKPICIALLAVWVTSPMWTIFLPIPEYIVERIIGEFVFTLAVGFGVPILAIIYLVYSQGKGTAKYPAVICLSLVGTGILAVMITP